MSLLRPHVSDVDASAPPVVPSELPPLAALSGARPRAYQVELLVWAWLDFQAGPRGTLAYLPTGAGKTLVAALTVSFMVGANPTKRVAFVVDKVPLLQQQAAYLRRETGLRVVTFSGETRGRVELFKQPFEVLVVTAQVLVNSLARGELHATQFSLLVIDEAHHALGEHPFVKVMAHARRCPEVCRPRLLALTASPAGAATECRTDDALKKLEGNLFASLRAPSLQREALKEAMRKPAQEWITAEISGTMAEFEEEAIRVLDVIERDLASDLGEHFIRVGAGDVGTGTRLAAWQTVRGYVEEHCAHLLAHVSLAVSIAEAAELSCRLGDAHGRDFLKRSGALANLHCAQVDVREITSCMAAWPQGRDAPHFERIEQLVSAQAVSRGETFRAIIFVATRSMAQQVAGLLQERLPQLSPSWLVGGSGRDGDGEDAKLDRGLLLSRFREGAVRLIVATSVAEEGLDVAECSLVVRLHGVRAFAAHVQSRGRARAANSTYVIVGTSEEQRKFEELQAAEENLQHVVDARMDSVPASHREVAERSIKQLLADEEARGAVMKPAVVDRTRDDVLIIVAHGLPRSTDDDALRVFSQHGTVVSCTCESHGFKPPDQLRPAGYSAVVLLEAEKGKSADGLLSRLAGSSPGIWFRREVPSHARPNCRTVNLRSTVEVGILLRPGVFAKQIVLHGTTVHVAPEQRAIVIRFQDAVGGYLDDDSCSRSLRARINVASMADTVLVDTSNGPTVFLLVTEPPQFWVEETQGRTNRTRSERCCMPPALFGSSFVYAFRVNSSEDMSALLAFVDHVGIRACYTQIGTAEHALEVPEFPIDHDNLIGCTGFDWDWQDDEPSEESHRSSRLIQLVRTLNGPVVNGELAHARGTPAIAFDVLYAFLCALGQEPLLLCSALSVGLLAALRNLPNGAGGIVVVQKSLAQLSGKLFQDAVYLVSDASEDFHQQGRMPPTSTPSHHVLVRSVVVAPTRVVFRAVEEILSNRVLRKFGEPDRGTADRFLRVQFRDEDGSELVGRALVPRIQQIFEQGISILDRHYKYLHWSNSQMRTSSFWLYASEGEYSCEDIRAWVFLVPANVPRAPSKYASRLALFFSSSLPTIRIPWTDVVTENDVESDCKQYCFTDGSGRIRQDVADGIASTLGLKPTPSAFQIRFGGAKGVVVAYAPAGMVATCKNKLVLRPSMVKFASHDDSFEVLSWSRRIQRHSTSKSSCCWQQGACRTRSSWACTNTRC